MFCVLQPMIDEKIQLVPKAQLGSWGKGSSGGAKASEMGEWRVPCLRLGRLSGILAVAFLPFRMIDLSL